MERKEIHKKFWKILWDKEQELKKERDGMFINAWNFEANATGQVGEILVKNIIADYGYQVDFKTIHDEYDLVFKNKKIEIKTAKLGKNKTFQFNGINTKYNYDFLICIGIEYDVIDYLILSKDQFFYDHKTKNEYVRFYNGKKEKCKKLVCMNPKNETNKKLTLSISDLSPEIENLFNKLNELVK
ncbi:MAG: hypothetical protein L3I91_02245 [Mycoplasma sp.]